MKPEQFIREFGEKKAREVVEGIPSKYMECYYSTLCYCTKAKSIQIVLIRELSL